MSCQTVRLISKFFTLLVKADLKFVTEMLFNKHCYFCLGHNILKKVIFMRSPMEDFFFFFFGNIIILFQMSFGGLLFLYYAIYLFLTWT